jgi:hypothetical protein
VRIEWRVVGAADGVQLGFALAHRLVEEDRKRGSREAVREAQAIEELGTYGRCLVWTAREPPCECGGPLLRHLEPMARRPRASNFPPPLEETMLFELVENPIQPGAPQRR